MEIAAIIPAYNEEKSVAGVIKAVRSCPEITQIIVVNDGSTDRTAKVAREQGAQVIDLPVNMGKGAAVTAGVKATSAPILLLLDADLLGLRPHHLRALLCPILQERADMTVGVFKNGRLLTDLSQRLTPFLNGQRALRREAFTAFSGLEPTATGYGVDFCLSRFARESGLRVELVALDHLTQIMKEEKRGFWPGLTARFKMYQEVVTAMLRLRIPPQ